MQMNIDIALKKSHETPSEKSKIPVIPENRSTSRMIKASMIHVMRMRL
jgi:hypothetical protein